MPLLFVISLLAAMPTPSCPPHRTGCRGAVRRPSPSRAATGLARPVQPADSRARVGQARAAGQPRWVTLGFHRVAQRMSVCGRDAGMSTAEYAVGTLAAAGLAAVLYQVATSDAVSGALQQLVEGAFSAPA